MSTSFYLPQYFIAEHESAAIIALMLATGRDRVQPVTDGLSKLQPQAVEMACQYPVSILCGPPGTGKTTTLQRIVDSYEKAGMSTLVLSPTAKGAKRADDVINAKRETKINCMTAHRGLGYNPALDMFERSPENTFEEDLIIMEEFSMLGMVMLWRFLYSVNWRKSRVLFCGDPYQLPSVEPGNVARDLIFSGCIPTTTLDHIFRTGANSGIAVNAKRILNGEMPLKHDPITGEAFTDFYFVNKEDPVDGFNFILENACKKIPDSRGYDPLKDIQVLSPGKKGEVGTLKINKAMRERLSSAPNGSQRIGQFAIGDKVVNRNNERKLCIVNGDIGTIKDITDVSVVFDFGPGSGPSGTGIVEVPREDFGSMSIYHSYCNTVHTTQGSEYKAVLFPLYTMHYNLLFRELYYTAETRAKELCVVVGQERALRRAVQNNLVQKRNTNFQSIIRNACSKSKP